MLKAYLMGALCSVVTALSAPAWAVKTVDILVLYNSSAQAQRNGADINARAAAYVAYANKAYTSSNVDMQLRLVGVQKLELPLANVSEANLNALRQNSTVAQLRRQYGADVVTYLTLSQSVSGGSICGIGFIPSGSPTTGTFYTDSASLAFNLVGIDCNLNVLTHEVGHNMGLGHSYVQNSVGGVFNYGRGYGVMGLFSTVMAYPQSYGTTNQLPIFSNPSLKTCSGNTCGVERTRADGADAAASLNALAVQISNFSPVIVPLAPPTGSTSSSSSSSSSSGKSITSSSSSSSSSSSGQSLALCNRTEQAGNLIKNGEFSVLDGWVSGLGASSLTLNNLANGTCMDKVLLVNNRKSYLGDAFYSLSTPLVSGTKYRLSARASIRNSTRDNLRVAVVISGASGKQLYELTPVSLTPNEFTNYVVEFTAPTTGFNGVLFFGPQAGVDIALDGVSLVPVAAAPTAPANSTLINESFETTANGWSAVFGGSASIVNTAAVEGKNSLRISQRTSVNSGAAVQLGSQLKAGTNYTLSAKMRAGATTAGTANLQIWILFNDSRGAQKISLGAGAVPVNVWAGLNAGFNIYAVGTITNAQITFVGPAAGQDLFLDAVKLTQ